MIRYQNDKRRTKLKITSMALATLLGATAHVAKGRAEPRKDSATRATPIADAKATVDKSLLEVNGITFKDQSYSAASKRAAYFESLLASGNATTHEPISSANNNCLQVDHYFGNFGTAPGYTLDYGYQGPGQEGFLMHSDGTSSSLLHYNYVFNDGSAPFTLIRAWFRGAPNDGKNSYVTLREPQCVGASVGCGDELDIVESYGFPPNPRSEWTIYQPRYTGGNVGTGRYPTDRRLPNPDPGHNLYSYTVYLERGNYVSLTIQAPDGLTLGTWERHANQGYVPQNPMLLYAGIWDCSSMDTNHQWCVDGSGSFNGDTYAALVQLQMWTCY
jgi:hypothetical protein